jgi:hypothetical protein
MTRLAIAFVSGRDFRPCEKNPAHSLQQPTLGRARARFTPQQEASAFSTPISTRIDPVRLPKVLPPRTILGKPARTLPSPTFPEKNPPAGMRTPAAPAPGSPHSKKQAPFPRPCQDQSPLRSLQSLTSDRFGKLQSPSRPSPRSAIASVMPCQANKRGGFSPGTQLLCERPPSSRAAVSPKECPA